MMCCHAVRLRDPLWSNVYFLASSNGWLQPLFTGRVGAQKGSGKPKAPAKRVFFGGFPTGTRTKGRTLQLLLARALRSVRYIPCRPEERWVSIRAYRAIHVTPDLSWTDVLGAARRGARE